MLDPKPPELLNNIAWFAKYWRKHTKHIAVALCVLVIGFLANTDELWEKIIGPSKNENERAPVSQASTAPSVDSSKSTSPAKRPALIVVFKDGGRAYVSLSFTTLVQPELIPEAHALFGSLEAIETHIQNVVESAAYTVLESKSLSYVRQHRNEVANEILSIAQPEIRPTAYIVQSLQIAGIESDG